CSPSHTLTTYHHIYNSNAYVTIAIYTLSLHDALPISRATALQSSALALLHRLFDLAGCLLSVLRHPFPPGFRCTATTGSLNAMRSEEHTSELQSRENLVCRLLLEKKRITVLYGMIGWR